MPPDLEQARRRASRRCCRPRRLPAPCPRRPRGTRRRASCRAYPRTASAGFSSIAITCSATTCSSPLRVETGRAVEHRNDPVGGSLERSDDDLVRAAVAAHGVDGDPGRSPREAGVIERLDVAALVRLAVRADAVRPLRLAAGRADVHARRFDPVLGAALVAAGLGGFLLRDSHWSRGSIATRISFSCWSAAQRGSPCSSSCSCGSAFRSRPQTGQSPAQSGRQRILSGQREDQRVARPGREVEPVVDQIRRRQLLRVGARRLVLAQLEPSPRRLRRSGTARTGRAGERRAAARGRRRWRRG